MQSVLELSILIKNGYDSAIVIGNYLDEFKNDANTNEERIISISAETVKGNIEKMAYLASLVEHLCVNYNLEIPTWVNKKEYFLKSPVFYSSFENLKATLIQESPVSFRRHNIFVSSNVLSRV